MKYLLHRAISLHLSPLPALRPSPILFYSSAGEDPPRRRSDPYQPSSPPYLPHRRHYDEESRHVRVTVWWDFENCNVPVGVNVCLVAQRITSVLRSSGIRGPVMINAFGDVAQLSRATQEALTSTGVGLTHVPHCGKNSSDRFFMADLVYWVTQNPPPMHFFLISGDRDFANILHRLRMSNYNILLASNDSASGVLCSAATIMWPWNGLVRGENIGVKHFNHPPDGIYGSWYGHYKGVLDDPFADDEQQANAQPEESMEQIADSKPRPIPKAVMNGIRHILHSNPEGIHFSELRTELKRNNIIMDKDYFGHKKFSLLLSSMPNVLRFIPHPSGEGQPLVVSAQRRVMESVQPSAKPASDSEANDMDNKDQVSCPTGKPSKLPTITTVEPPPTSKVNTMEASVDPSPTCKENAVDASLGPSTSTSSHGHDFLVEEGMLKRIWRTLGGPQFTKPDPSLDSKDADAGTVGCASVSGDDVVAEKGFFRKIWRTLAGPGGDDSSEKYSADVYSTTMKGTGKDGPSLQSKIPSEKVKFDGKAVPLKGVSFVPPGSPSTSSDPTKSHLKNISTRQSEDNINVPDTITESFRRMVDKLKFWKSTSECEDDNSSSAKEVGKSQESSVPGEQAKVSTQSCVHPEAHDLFSKSHFWDSLESFLVTARGSDLILKSRTREHLVHGLQKEGPWILKDLKESHLFQLVNLMISEKKWVGESPHSFPFKLTLTAKRRFIPSYSQGHNGLSSLFTGRISQFNLQGLLEQDKRYQNPSHPVNALTGSLDAKPPQNLAELKAWFQRTYSGTEHVEPEDFQKLFESKFNQKLACSTYGYTTLRNLMTAILTDTTYNQGNRRKPPSREEILSDCHKLLVELLEENPNGFNMSIFRPAFIQRYGYVLDYQMLGYPKLVSLLQIMPEVRIESTFVLPAEKFYSNSNLEKVAMDESIAHSEEGEKGKPCSLDSEGPSNGEDSAWDELGPVSRSDVPEDNNISQEQIAFRVASLSEEEFTDSEDDAPIQLDGSEGLSRRGEEDSSLLQILDSWYSSKEDGEKDQIQAADGLVDCSRSNAQKPSDLKPTIPVKTKSKPYRSYSFVSETRDEKEMLVDSILGSLKKAGDSRLQS